MYAALGAATAIAAAFLLWWELPLPALPFAAVAVVSFERVLLPKSSPLTLLDLRKIFRFVAVGFSAILSGILLWYGAPILALPFACPVIVAAERYFKARTSNKQYQHTYQRPPPGGFAFKDTNAGRKAGRKHRVATAYLEMVLDYDSGDTSGTVLDGAFAGWALNRLGIENLVDLWRELSANDPDGRELLEAYLDRYHPDWRTTASSSNSKTADDGQMTRAQALDILGLKEGASKEDIKHAYAAAMKKNHPDHGGSNYIAARINRAREVLLS
jgi:hypothetical protein